MDLGLVNANPIVYPKSERRVCVDRSNTDEFSVEPIDRLEIFDHIRDIKDPEHSEKSLEDLRVLIEESVEVDNEKSYVRITFRPTVPHCQAPNLIGLCIYAKLLQSLPARFKFDVSVEPGSHDKEAAVNKQLKDKERVVAALENPHLMEVIRESH